MHQRDLVLRTASYIFLTVASLIMVYPLIYMLLGAFTTPDQYVDGDDHQIQTRAAAWIHANR